MFRKYHHGHSIGVGVLIGLLLTQHPFALACLSFAAGALTVWAVLAGRQLAHTLLAAFEAWRDQAKAKRQTIHDRPQPVYTGKFPKGY